MQCAEAYSAWKYPAVVSLNDVCNLQRSNGKIKLAYLCGEFRAQATSVLMVGVWELHDKNKFEIIALDNGYDDKSNIRSRIANAFEKIIDISAMSDIAVAKLISEERVDILVNLNGFFGEERQGVFALKPAPIQVNYLGFPGTMGIDYMDYLICDKVVVPEQSRQFYTEKIVYLPHSYQANDSGRKIAELQFERSDFGLPDVGFVFCCFNNNYKITPSMFESWVRILTSVEGSVLWLLKDNDYAVQNLLREIGRRGLDQSRLVFAQRLDGPEHLARHRLADLFLDTLPYNAHTTASDALWAGLPVLTIMGTTFPGRVAASLLNAVGLPELIAQTQEQYEFMAIDLAHNPARLSKLKESLERNRLTTPLFDTDLYTRNLEAAYSEMYERCQSGLPSDHIDLTLGVGVAKRASGDTFIE